MTNQDKVELVYRILKEKCNEDWDETIAAVLIILEYDVEDCNA